MKKKDKSTPRVSTGQPEKLTHSPFAGLTTRAGDAAPPRAAEVAQPPATPETAAAPPKSRGRLVLRRETKHRGGKAVIVVSGFEALRDFDAEAIDALAKECKRALGCGGTASGGELVLQGDRPAEVAALLRDKGFRVAGVTS